MPNEREIAATLMGDAAKIISTERGQQHGDLEQSFTMIAQLWSTYAQHAITAATGVAPMPEIHFNAVDVLEMMSLVKKARNVYGGKLPDHSIDDIGYTGLAGGLRLRDTINEKIRQEVEASMRKTQEEASTGEDNVTPIPAFLKEKKA